VRSRIGSSGAALVVALAAPLAAQQGAAPSIFGETVEVRVVNLEVEVTDRDGFAVTGLTPADFELEVDGQAVPIRYFTEIRGGTAVATAEAGPAKVGGVPDLVPGEPVGTSYLVFVDDFFPLARDRDRVLAALRDDVGRLKPEDRMAVVAFDGAELAMLSTWTNSQRELERVLRDAARRPAHGLRRLSERRSLATDRAASRSFPGIDSRRLSRLDTRLDVGERFYAETLEQQLDNVVSAAAAALRGFANPPGRKVLLLLAGGWPFDVGEFVTSELGRTVAEPGIKRGRELFAPLIDTANQVGYAIFPVDVPGLAAASLVDAETAVIPEDDARFESFLRENNQQYTLQRIAAETGGKALLNARRLEARAAAQAATRSYYRIGFSPTWQGDDGLHSVSVRVRRDNLRTRTRTSYVDFSRGSEVTAAVESVLLFGGGPGVLDLALSVGRPLGKASARRMQVPLAFELPTAQLTLLPSAEGAVAELELRVAAIDERGGRSEIPVVPMRLVVPAEGPGALVARYETLLELRRMRNRIVVAVYDPASGNLWSKTAEVSP
jgi:VWFA-related protein